MENKDGGYASRKFWLSVVTMAAMVISGVYLKDAVLSTVVIGLLGTFATYCGVNLGINWLGLKKDIATAVIPDDPEEEPVVETPAKK
jgi:hypothetical protein